MRSALGLILGCVVAAVVIAGVFFFVLSPRADLAAPQTVAARLADPLLLPAGKLAAKDDVEVTAAISAKPAAPPLPVVPQKPACANPDALGVSRVVERDGDEQALARELNR